MASWMIGERFFWRASVLSAVLIQGCLAQHFIEPSTPSIGGSVGSTRTANVQNYTIGRPVKVQWQSDFKHVDLELWSEHVAPDGTMWNQTIAKNLSSSSYTFEPSPHIPLDDGARFYFALNQIDPATGLANGPGVDSASFIISSAPSSSPSSLNSSNNTTTSPPTSVSSSSASNQPTASEDTSTSQMPSSTTIGTAVGLSLLFLLLSVAITGGIWFLNRRRRRLQEEQEARRQSLDPDEKQFPIVTATRVTKRQKPLPQIPAECLREAYYENQNHDGMPWSPHDVGRMSDGGDLLGRGRERDSVAQTGWARHASMPSESIPSPYLPISLRVPSYGGISRSTQPSPLSSASTRTPSHGRIPSLSQESPSSLDAPRRDSSTPLLRQ